MWRCVTAHACCACCVTVCEMCGIALALLQSRLTRLQHVSLRHQCTRQAQYMGLKVSLRIT